MHSFGGSFVVSLDRQTIERALKLDIYIDVTYPYCMKMISYDNLDCISDSSVRGIYLTHMYIYINIINESLPNSGICNWTTKALLLMRWNELRIASGVLTQ